MRLESRPVAGFPAFLTFSGMFRDEREGAGFLVYN
jgi:hypothetical protein